MRAQAPEYFLASFALWLLLLQAALVVASVVMVSVLEFSPLVMHGLIDFVDMHPFARKMLTRIASLWLNVL